MTFSSILFLLGFLPLFLVVYFLSADKVRNGVLLAASLFFYAWAQPSFVWLILADAGMTWMMGILLAKWDSRSLRKALFALAVLADLGTLVYFKYLDFIIRMLNRVFHGHMNQLNLVLPIGISFYVFKSISYLADVYRGTTAAEKNPLCIAVYMMNFPQVMSGPIDRDPGMSPAIHARTVTTERFAYGIQRLIIGLTKKAVLADTLGAFVNQVWNTGLGTSRVSVVWIASAAYTLQIYYDFSGYSDMAIGIGHFLGFDFPENFNLPYVSRSVTEFWRRWHITLGSWFRDYVYIPLGGNRKRVYLNLFIVFLLTGIWHGAAWSFFLWGIWHGLLVCAERRVIRRKQAAPSHPALAGVLSHLYLLCVVNFGWVLFRAGSLSNAKIYLRNMAGILSGSWSGFSLSYYLDRWTLFVLAAAAFFASGVPSAAVRRIRSRMNETAYTVLKHCVLLLLLWGSVMTLMTDTYHTFIYFQF